MLPRDFLCPLGVLMMLEHFSVKH
nr:unnamed protein product [Callosobruchus chinensis]